jgi:hypothetical protein
MGGALYFLVGRDAAAAVDGAAAVGHLHVIDVTREPVLVGVVVVKGQPGIVALDQAPAGGIKVRRGERQRGAIGEREDGLDQALAEGGFAQHPGAVVVLQRTRNDFRGRSRPAVHQHHDGVIAAAVAMIGGIDLLRGGTATLRYHHLTLAQKVVGYIDGLVQQTARVFAQIHHQALDAVLAQVLEGVVHLPHGIVAEAQNLEISDSRFEPEGGLHAGADDILADHFERDRLGHAFAPHRDLDRAAAVPLQQIDYFGGGEPVGGFAVHRNDGVAGANAGAIGRRSGKGRVHHGLVVARGHLHADPGIVPVLVFFPERVLLGVEEGGMRIEAARDARQCAVINRVAGAHRRGEILFHQRVGFGESRDGARRTPIDGRIRRRRRPQAAGEPGPRERTQQDEENQGRQTIPPLPHRTANPLPSLQ